MNTLLVPKIASLTAATLLAAGGSGTLDGAIRAALDDTDIPFRLEVSCSDRLGQRSMTVFGGDIAVWDRVSQVRLSSLDRKALLSLLLDSGFSGFEARYGARDKAEKQEAPLRVSCRVHVEIEQHKQSSVQLLDGEPSAELLGLAGSLLDVVGEHAADGVGATSLEDGLAKLAGNELAPEVLELRLLRLPKRADAGFILRIHGGTVSRQPYAPGERVGDPETRPLDHCLVRTLVDALVEGQPWRLPRNLRGDGMAELDVGILGARSRVIARATFRSDDAAAEARFDELVERLDGLFSACGGR